MRMARRKKKDETPGPPRRPRDRRERAAKRIWATEIGRGGRSFDCWVEDPKGNVGISITPPWAEIEETFAVGEMEGAYDIFYDEAYGLRRLIVYEGMPTAPVALQKGNWQPSSDMAAETEAYIYNVEKEKAAQLADIEEPFPRWGYAMIVFGIMLTAVAILSMVT